MPAAVEPGMVARFSAVSSPIMIVRKKLMTKDDRGKEQNGKGECTAFWSDVSTEGVDGIGEDEEMRKQVGEVEFQAAVEDGVRSVVLEDGDDESDGEEQDGEFEGFVENSVGIEDGIDSGSEIGLSSSEDEDYQEGNKGVTGDSASETYYEDEDDLTQVIHDDWKKQHDFKVIGRVYDSSSCSDSESDYTDEGRNGEVRVEGGLEMENDKKPSLKNGVDSKGGANRSVVKWRGVCDLGCKKRTDLERRLGVVLKLLSEFQLWTAEQAAEGGCGKQEGVGAGRKGKQSETARLRREVEKLRVTLDYLTRMSLGKAMELHTTFTNR